MAITTAELTEGENTLTGSGVFDTMMKAVRSHLGGEYDKQRIKGTDYANVYLGAMTEVLGQSASFLLARDLKDLERQILEVELQKAVLEKDKVAAEILLVGAQVTLTEKEGDKVDADILRINADTSLAAQREANLLAEAANIPKIGAKLDAETLLIGQQEANLVLEADNIPKEGLVLDAQKCKFDAEFDLLMEQVTKTTAETGLLTQKKVTEQAQTQNVASVDSVVGKQIALYAAQANGFTRDSEQKAAKLMIDSWNVRRTTDEATSANTTNKLDDASVGGAVAKLLAGIGA